MHVHLKHHHDDGPGHEEADRKASLQHRDDDGDHHRPAAHHPEEHLPRVEVLRLQRKPVGNKKKKGRRVRESERQNEGRKGRDPEIIQQNCNVTERLPQQNQLVMS